MNAKRAQEVKKFEDIPNIGPKMARNFRLVGLVMPEDLKHKNPLDVYQQLCQVTGIRQDPCVLDTCMAAVDFMNGAPARSWWSYTQKRKQKYPDL